jgi:4-hydroxybenzoate polyprenyltransferase
MTSAEVAKPAGPAQALALVRALRVHQWVKNLLVFVPVVLDHKLFSADTVAKSATAFAAFCCAASSAYILNDLLDLEADRRYPTK